MVVLDNGNVGIGTNTPISLLQIGSGSGFLGDFTTPAVTFNNLNNGIYLDSNRINFKAGGSFSFGADSNGPLGNGFRINAADYDNLTTPIFVATRLSLGINSGYGGNKAGHLSLITSGSSRIYIDYSGSVGIGTTTPTYKLDVSGSSNFTGNVLITGSVNIDGGLFDTVSTGSIPTGSTLIYTINTGSYQAGFFDYYVSSGSNFRAGNIMSVWGAGTYKFTDLATPDIGSTSNLQFSMSLSASSAQLFATASSAGWTVKTTFRTI
jgi:hypothetical protein